MTAAEFPTDREPMLQTPADEAEVNGFARPEPWEVGPPPGFDDDEPGYPHATESQQRAQEAPRVLSLVERARELRKRGPVVRLATGLSTLDANCRGGLRFGTVVSVGGAPGAGKTATVVQWARDWALQRVPVAIVCSDEGPEDITMRIALHEGLDPTKLEEGDSEEWDELERRLVLLPTLRLLDAEDGHTIETAAAYLQAAHPGTRAVVLGDSAQTLSVAVDADSPRARVDAVLRSAKGIGRRGFLVVLTSELARQAYKSRVAAENIEPLAAFKESGGIEYACQTALVLRSLPKGDGAVAVDVPKNRGGRKEGFTIEIDARTRVRECRTPEEPTEEDRQANELTKVERDAVTVLRVIANHPGIGARDLREHLVGEGSKLGRDALGGAMARLLATGRIRNEPELKGQREYPHYFAVATGGDREVA